MRKSLRQLLESTGSFKHSIRFTSLYFTLVPFNDIKYDYHIPKDKNGTRAFGKRSIYLSLIPTDSVSRRLRLFDNMSSSLGWNKEFSPSIIKFVYGKPYWTKVVDIFLFKSGFFIQVDISFSSWGFQFKSRSFLFKSRCFNSSRNLFSSIFFSCRDFYFKSMFVSHVENFFMWTFFFSRGEFFFISSQNFCSLSQLKARCYLGVLVGNDKSNKITRRSVF